MILFGLHLNKPYLLLFDSRSWNDESWEVQLMRSSCQSRRCIQCWDLIAPKCWEFFCHFFVGIPMENLYHCIEQIDTTCDFSVWNWDFMGFFPDFWMWIGISNGSTTVISQFMFCIISTSVGGMITAAWWLSLSNSDPMIPKMINHWTTGKSCCLSLFFLFEGCFASMLWLEKLHGKTIERPKLTRRIRRKTMATPTTTMTTRRTIALNLMLLQDCMHVSRSSQLFLPDPPPGPPVGPTFFFGRFILPTNNKWKSFLSSANHWISSSANHCWWEKSGIFCQAVALSHLLDPARSARRCNKVLHPDGRCEKQKKPMERGTYREVHGILISQSFLETSFETLPVQHFCVCIWLLHTCTSSWDIVWRLIFCQLLKHEDGVETLQSWSAFGPLERRQKDVLGLYIPSRNISLKRVFNQRNHWDLVSSSVILTNGQNVLLFDEWITARVVLMIVHWSYANFAFAWNHAEPQGDPQKWR